MGKITKVKHVKGGGRYEWFLQRQQLSGLGDPNVCRFGASEISTIIGMNKYESPIKLFYNKIGMYITPKKSQRMSAGLSMEQTIKLRYEQFDLDPEVMVDNMENNNRVKRLIAPKHFLLNSDYPNIFASNDFVCPANQHSFFTGEVIPFAFPVEAKNVVYDSFKSWNGDVAQMYRVQNNVQQMVMGVDYGEIVVLVDGWEIHVFPIERDVELCKMIDYKVREFSEKVILGKQIRQAQLEDLAEGGTGEEYEAMLHRLEPDADALGATNDFLIELYPESEDKIIIATPEIEKHYREYLIGMELEKEAKAKKQLAQNTFIQFMGESERINFKKNDGKVIYRRKAQGKPYFSVK